MSIEVKQESGLAIFNNPEFGSVRGKEEPDGTIWVVAKDVAVALEYAEASNTSRLFASVPNNWKGVKPIHTPGGVQEMLVLYEQGLYFFLARSDKPKAIPFQMWLANDVVPSIRKTGFYSTQPALPNFSNPAEAARAWADQYEARVAAERKLEQVNEYTAKLSTITKQLCDVAKGQMDTIAKQKNDIENMKDCHGYGNNWKTVANIPWLWDFFDMREQALVQRIVGHKLSKLGRSMGLYSQMVHHAGCQYILRHHTAVIEKFRQMLIDDPDLMWKYRIY